MLAGKISSTYYNRMEALDTYLHARRISLAEFGERVGVNPATVHKWRKGKALPKYELRRKISKATGGKVPVKAWENTK